MPRLFSLGLIAASALAATACGANAVPSDDVGAAGASTKAAGSARVEMVTRVSVVGSPGESFEFRSTAIVDYANDRSVYTEQRSGCRTIAIGDVTYGEHPFDESFPAGKRWVKSGIETVENETLFEQSQEQTTSEDGMTTSTSIVVFSMPEPAPDKYLDYLRDSSGEPELIGHEDVRGVSTTRYRSTIDVRRLMRQELEEAGWKEANVERYLEGVQSAQEIEVWIDSEGLARRIVTTDKSPGAEEGMTGDWVTTTELFDFGLETDIQPPPAAEVMDSDEWERIAEEWMRKQLDEYRVEIDEGIEPLPGAFDPSTLPDADSEQAASCLR